tara:strand:+ start:1039 stop:1500 length:462 start_codon:yes stop_codon:yes gene_type:complete
MAFKVVEHKSKYNQDFYILNKSWIEVYWELEEADNQTLLNPEKSIIQIGGQIFFLLYKTKVIGTVAMIPSKNNTLELAKMTVKKEFRGLGLSKKLMDKCIEFAEGLGYNEIFLVSNRKLKTARELYNKYDFKEVSIDSQKYLRGDIKLILTLK